MNANPETSGTSKFMLWSGRVISAVPVLMLTMSGVMKVMQIEPVTKEFARLGYPLAVVAAIGVVELICTLFYVIPRTAVLGAILLTGYLGGATATHVRLEENFIGPPLFGVMIWLGLVLRDARLRQLLPLRRPDTRV